MLHNNAGLSALPGNSLLGWLDEVAVSRHLRVVRLHLILNLSVLDEQGVVLGLQKVFLLLLGVQLEYKVLVVSSLSLINLRCWTSALQANSSSSNCSLSRFSSWTRSSFFFSRSMIVFLACSSLLKISSTSAFSFPVQSSLSLVSSCIWVGLQ